MIRTAPINVASQRTKNAFISKFVKKISSLLQKLSLSMSILVVVSAQPSQGRVLTVIFKMCTFRKLCRKLYIIQISLYIEIETISTV